MEMIIIYFNRKSIRLKNYDYSKNGMYYITICTHNREEILSEIEKIDNVGADDPVRPLEFPNIQIKLTSIGNIVNEIWMQIPKIYSNIKLDSFVIMPNHIHGIIRICDKKGRTELSVPTKNNSGI